MKESKYFEEFEDFDLEEVLALRKDIRESYRKNFDINGFLINAELERALYKKEERVMDAIRHKCVISDIDPHIYVAPKNWPCSKCERYTSNMSGKCDVCEGRKKKK